MDQRAQESDRLIAAQLAGDVTVINDDLADCLLAVVGSANEPEQLRAKAAISLGPVLEQAATDGFEDAEDVPITERAFRNIRDSLQKLYRDARIPKEVRRRILEASVRAPETWHQDAIRAKLPSMKASSRWNPPRSRSSSATASKMPRMIPERTRC